MCFGGSGGGRKGNEYNFARRIILLEHFPHNPCCSLLSSLGGRRRNDHKDHNKNYLKNQDNDSDNDSGGGGGDDDVDDDDDDEITITLTATIRSIIIIIMEKKATASCAWIALI